ncbi:MAG TPA: ComF family protein [Bacillota bacterium]|nr:ComF family protein [Bacillota bacterium]HOL10349.1 ComF family protein [Bacillota bacterium]HPO97363.1 ComF family protein [Bacillota bacterium]
MKYQNIRNFCYQLQKGFLELVFPPEDQCPICKQEKSKGHGLGARCLQKLSLVSGPICHKCGRPLRLEAVASKLCQQCSNTSYYFEAARAVALYEGALREYLAEFKYRFRPDLGAALGELLVEWIREHRDFQKVDLIVPIPIHPDKMRLRGYNQAELLAEPLKKYLGISLINDIIIRRKLTESQNALSKEERFQNVSGAFQVINTTRLKAAKVLLIDDIFTTGATASEAARVLLRAGTLKVKVLTLATGLMDSQWFASD